VAQTARDKGLGRSLEDEALRREIDEFFWFPDYQARPEGAEERVESKPGRQAEAKVGI
jgi:hypothetical protein